MNAQKKAVALTVVSMILMAAIPVLHKLSLKNMSALEIAFWNALICFIGSSGALAVKRAWPTRPSRDTVIAALLFAVSMFSFAKSLTLLHPAEVSLVSRLYTIASLLLGILVLNEQWSISQLGLLLLTVLCTLQFVGGSPGSVETSGYAWALCYALGFAAYGAWIKARQLQNASLQLLFWSYGISTLFYSAFCVIQNISPSFDPASLGLLAFSGLCGSLLGAYLFLLGLRGISLGLSAGIRSLSPAFAWAFALPFFDAKFSAQQLGAALLANLGIAALCFSQHRQIKKRSPHGKTRHRNLLQPQQ